MPAIPGSVNVAGATQFPSAAPAPIPPAPPSGIPGAGAVPFRRAVGPVRTSISTTTGPQALTASQQSVPITLPGSGYALWVDLFTKITSAGANGTANSVATAEDSPWSSIAAVTFDAGGPQNINIDGYSLYLANIYGGYGIVKDPALSADTNVFQQLVTGTAAAAGSGQFRLRVPLVTNERSLWGLMGNQDRATKYNLRDDIAASGSIYTTAPTVLPNVEIDRIYGWVPVPGPQTSDGRPQEQIPSHYGIVHYLTAIKSDSLPVGGSVINHYMRNLSNALRFFILVFRSNSSRATANANLPTQIDFVIGSDVVWSEQAAERRQLMWNRYGFDAPNGVLVYDCIRDFSQLAGFELGDEYLYLGNISEAQFRITYPSGFGSTANSLTIITDSLFIPDYVDIYNLSGLAG